MVGCEGDDVPAGVVVEAESRTMEPPHEGIADKDTHTR